MADIQPTPEHPFFQPLPECDSPSTVQLLRRLAGRVEVRQSDCWVWTGASNGKGYGWFEIQRRRVMVHRFIYEKCVGGIPGGLLVLHNCPSGDNPACCAPAHLWIGDAGDNNRDCVTKGRHASAKLMPGQIEEIHLRLASGARGIVKQLAEEYGVTPTAICNIRKGRTWRCSR